MRGPLDAARAWVRKAEVEEDVFDRFVYLWFAFNALYNEYLESREFDAITQFVQVEFGQGQDLSPFVESLDAQYFQRRIIHNCRNVKGPRRDTWEAACVLGSGRPPLRRLLALLSILYQVRCNLFHGNKRFDRGDDVTIVGHAAACLQRLLSAYLRI